MVTGSERNIIQAGLEPRSDHEKIRMTLAKTRQIPAPRQVRARSLGQRKVTAATIALGCRASPWRHGSSPRQCYGFASI